MVLPMFTCLQKCKWLATRVSTRNGLHFTGIRYQSQFAQALGSFGAEEIL